jgi:hypothetical protein
MGKIVHTTNTITDIKKVTKFRKKDLIKKLFIVYRGQGLSIFQAYSKAKIKTNELLIKSEFPNFNILEK